MWAKSHRVNRHTGGLENRTTGDKTMYGVNRHTGGLEMAHDFINKSIAVNRHTGGLESLNISHMPE